MDALIQLFGRLHPMVLHAPIGLLIGIATIELVSVLRKFDVPRQVRSTLMWLTALSALATAGTGLVLDREGTFGAASEVHQWCGLALAGACLIAALVQQAGKLAAFRVVLLLTVGLSIPTGHLGASLTHGETFLTEPFLPPKPPAPVKGGAETVQVSNESEYGRVIGPILADRCLGCHNAQKSKGHLRLDSPEWIAKGGEDGPVVVAFKPDESDVLIRALSPLEEDGHMPPKSKPQLTKEEIAQIRDWINRGASFTEAGPQRGATEKPTERKGAAAPATHPADPAALAAITDALVHVQPLAAGNDGLVIDFAAVASKMDDQAVRTLLQPVRTQVVELSLARTHITDGMVTLLAQMPNLKRLNLSGTAISDAGIAGIASMSGIEDLVIAQTQVSDIEGLKAMSGLRHLYCWGAKIGPEKLAELARARPQVQIDAGQLADGAALETEPPPVFTTVASKPAAAASEAPLTPINTICPVSGKPVDPTKLVVYKGKVVAMCCEHCAEAFLADPEKYAAKLEK